MGDLDDWQGWLGFRSAEAADLAASQFPPLPVQDDPLQDGTGRRVDPATGELLPAPLARRLTISGGVIRLGIVHGRTGDLITLDDPAYDLDDTEGVKAEVVERDTRDVVAEFSRRSRQRLRIAAASIDWHAAHRPGLHLLMITLTYPGDWRAAAPNPDAVTSHRRAFAHRYRRATGHALAVLWKREFQDRGAPHLHLYGWWPWRINGTGLHQWLSVTWYEVVGTGLEEHLNAGTGVDYIKSLEMSDPLRVGFYFANYTSAKGSKEYQNHAPEGWVNDNGSVGRYWGVTGLKRYGAQVLVTETDMAAIERLLRGVYRATARDRDDGRRPRTIRTRYSRRGKGPNGERRRYVWRRSTLTSLKGLDTGFSFLTKDGARLALDLARALTLDQAPPWPKGQPRPLP